MSRRRRCPSRRSNILHDALRRYAAAGQTIIYVTHRLDEVLDIADRVSVLRDGSMVGTAPRSELNEARLVELIVGRRASTACSRDARDPQ